MLSFLLFSLATSTFRPDHEVVMSVVAPWDETPLFEHILFFMTDFSSEMATQFLRDIVKNHDQLNNETFIWETAFRILPKFHHAFLKSQISIGFYTPRGEMYREMARTKGGSNYNDLMIIGEKLNTFGILCHYLPSDDLDVQPFELQYGIPQSIVYANIYNKEVAEYVIKLIDENIPFSFRPTSKTGKFGVNLRGFGIEMRPFKYSMEYGVKDSIVLESSKEVSLHKDETTENITGIPESYYDLLKEDMFAEKFTSWLENHNDTSLVKRMRDFTNNYPLYINEILKTNISNSSIGSLDQLYRMRYNGQTLSSLNGRVLSLPNLDIFTLIDVINKERVSRQILTDEFKLNETQLDVIFKSYKEDSRSIFFDTRSKYVHYYNDVMTDPHFDDYTDDFSIFYTPLNQMPRVRRPLAQYVLYIDPTTNNGFTELYYATNLIEEGYTVNLGLVPYFNLGSKLSKRIAFAFHHIARNVNSSEAIQFLLDAHYVLGVDMDSRTLYPTSPATYKAAYQLHANSKCLKWDELYKLFAGSPELDAILDTISYIKNAQIAIPCSYMNGKKVETSNGMNVIYYHAQTAITELAGLIRRFRITKDDDFDVFDIISRRYFVAKSLNEEVLYSTPKSLKISTLTYDRQLEYIDLISKTKWDYSNEGRLTNYFFLFCNDSVDTTTFFDFAKRKRFNSAQFKVNPEIPKNLRSIFPSSNSTCSLVVNGRVYEDIDPNDFEFYQLADDWNTYFILDGLFALDQSVKRRRVECLAYSSSLIIDWMAQSVVRRHDSDDFFQVKNPMIYATQNSTSDIVWELVVDPLTREFQRIASIINWVEKNNLAQIRLCLVLPFALNDSLTTLTTYYRSALDEDIAVFTMLNDTTTYSAMPDMPMSWVYESMRASTDLDNILLSQLKTHSQEGVYVLTNILLEGNCQTSDYQTAEGTELAIENEMGERLSDTTSMMNGYFQLQANPGKFNIEIGGARSASIFELPKTTVIIGSFVNPVAKILLNYRPGKEGMKANNVTASGDFATTDRVDVFSVASGHLYERLMKIMMLSVRKRSTHNVKFWIVKNFLSPTFKATLPIMAEKYNFSYQLVSYKWPTWLRGQVEKQRIIWGNKILFLDTIFPLDLERVIYIDADQTVRADLNELMRMDFQGAPYAFTPMCNSRNETEPFRFWKQGYWLNHLQGKPYHISALFAIDLLKFRQMAAGDLLRYHYHHLSSDPGSLANLDQDLPNYAQHQIPIFSLPQEWLWCETWCSDETMAKAKTIDLCNNPLTHAPKLHIAQTRIEEWPGLDELARNISAGPDDYQYKFFKKQETE
ncbi:hypothetical protein TVAG_022230 [Trichomonas vaginalis G3]|uniref:Uncharacterized protein n=1 Tax=Trichomonas vaginalis (strain ATCC PRA-98 / G3) TaxID=412133 RepID=A2FFU1_TRIV3|nr:UDP-glucose:glycoprotein glucosyltransferase family [Trichomonas vaginalis G3]EAX96240.1 hypothetical protein TVAG_022230 [Trichomonas vaginalis G3]KAI5520993.1 UDP-glucose:glycoprotein glucosyltransferase family [Trichomonas vaginalis G3]|eukprot:XP_001309170.1 hypothetical protein [Trichomonas vaginalis G3]